MTLRTGLILVLVAAAVTVGMVVWWWGEEGDPVAAALAAKTPEPLLETVTVPAAGATDEREEASAQPSPKAVLNPSTEQFGPLSNNASIKVQVLAEETGDPLGGIRLNLVSREDQGSWRSIHVGGVARSLETNRAGMAEFEVPPWRDLSLKTWGRYRAVEDKIVDVGPLAPSTKADLTIILATKPDLELFGRVIDDKKGSAIEGAIVKVHERGSYRDDTEGVRQETRTSSDGSFLLSLRSWQDLYVTIEVADYSEHAFRITGDHQTPLEQLVVRLRQHAELALFVVDGGGKGVGGVGVRLSLSNRGLTAGDSWTIVGRPGLPEWTGTTESDGACLLLGISPGVPLDLELAREGKTLERVAAPIVLEAGATKELEVAIGRGATVVGSVVKSDGSPLPRREVWLGKAESQSRGYWGLSPSSTPR